MMFRLPSRTGLKMVGGLAVATTVFLMSNCADAQGATLAFWSFDSQTMSPTSGIDATTATMSTTGFTITAADGTAPVSFGTTGNNPSAAISTTPSTFDLRLGAGSTGAASTNYNNGGALKWSINAVGYNAITAAYDTYASSSTAFTTQTFFYSINGGATYTQFGAPVTVGSAYTASPMETFNLSSISALNNNANDAFEVVFSGAGGYTGSKAPNNRVDNVTVQGNAITGAASAPEPMSLGLLLLGVVPAGFTALRRRVR